MKSNPFFIGIVAAIFILSTFNWAAHAMDDPGFKISRMVMSAKIVEREPAAVAESFPAATEKVFCFLEATAVEHDTTVSFVWYFEGKEMARILLPLRKGKRWRTYSSKKLAGLTGNWRVELQDATGVVLHSVSFQVQ